MAERSTQEFKNLSDTTSPDLDWNLINIAIRDLTPREFEAAKLAAQGLADKEIAAKLRTTPQTIKSYLHRVYEKLSIQINNVGNARVTLARVFSDLEKHASRLEEFEDGSGI